MRREKRILVVDDDDAIRALLATVLRRRGLRVDTARNGEEALLRLSECRYVLLVLDLMMPRMSGYEVIDYLAGRGDANRPLVLVLTAGLEPKALDTNIVVGTVHKPFDIEMLVDTISGCLSVVDEQEQIDPCERAAEEKSAEGGSAKPN
ncbi:MAG TPA: response regulator [Thermoanaerobaculia bacterium]|jgi:two-component system response regulator ResD